MSKLKKTNFIEGAFIATICIVITKILGLIYVIPFYDIIGQKGGALYGYAYNIYNVFLITSSAGIPLAISKLTSEYNTLNMQNDKSRMYKIATNFILIFSLISFIICFFFARAIADLILGEIKGGNTLEDAVFVIRIISFALLIIPFLSIKRGYLQGHKFIKEPSTSQVIEQAVRILIILGGSFICVKVLKLPIKYAIGISVFGAFLGGVASLIYLKIIVKKNKEQIGLEKEVKSSKDEDKKILKKILSYSIPFVIINLANTVYNSTDMILILRTLPKIGYQANVTEFISSVFTTWGVKFNSIITAISTGLIISLIPNIVSDFVKNNMKEVNNNFNKGLSIILLIIAPIAIFISSMSNSFWTIFYGQNILGSSIIRITILIAVCDCLYIVLNSLLQSLNEQKIIYFSMIFGIILNLLLDVPFMYLFNKINIPSYYGAMLATFIGVTISNTIGIVHLKKKLNFNYSNTIKVIPRFIFSIILLLIIVNIFKIFLPFNSPSRLKQVLNITITGIFGGGLYLIINFKYLKDILPEKLLRKLKFIK